MRVPASGVPVLRAEHRWRCPSCTELHVTKLAAPHAPMHQCRGQAGLLVPFVPAGARAVHVVREREDYVGDELVQLAPGTGRPVMAVQTIHDDGHEDATVYAPAARATIGAL